MAVPSSAEHRVDSDLEAGNLAEAVRSACLSAALHAYEDARMRGLCEDGAWEAAVGAIRSVEVLKVIRRERSNDESGI